MVQWLLVALNEPSLTWRARSKQRSCSILRPKRTQARKHFNVISCETMLTGYWFRGVYLINDSMLCIFTQNMFIGVYLTLRIMTWKQVRVSIHFHCFVTDVLRASIDQCNYCKSLIIQSDAVNMWWEPRLRREAACGAGRYSICSHRRIE